MIWLELCIKAICFGVLITLEYYALWELFIKPKKREAFLASAMTDGRIIEANLDHVRDIEPYKEKLGFYKYVWAGKIYNWNGIYEKVPETETLFFRVSPRHAQPLEKFGGVEDDWIYVFGGSVIVGALLFFCFGK